MNDKTRDGGGADVCAPVIRDNRTTTSYPFWVIISPQQVMEP